MIGMIGIPGERLQVINVDADSPLREAGLQTNDVIADANGETFLLSEDFFSAVSDEEGDATFTILRGEQGEEIQATLDSTPDFAPIVDTFAVYIVGVAENAPADEAGMQPGDLIVGFNGDPISSTRQLIDLTGANLGNEITLDLRRGDEIVQIELVPRENPPEGEGAMGIVIDTAFYNTGAGLYYRPLQDQAIVPLGFGDAVRYSTARFASIFTAIASLPGQLTSGEITAAEARPVSIVGISQVGGVFLQQSIEEERPIEILNYIAIISIALGFTNLLPLPALDGGRILFVLIEMVRGKPIPPERESVVHLLGLAFLLSLTVVIVINDILNPVTDLIR